MDLKFYNVKAVPECVIHGRTDLEREDVPLFWNNSGVEVCVDATELWVEVEVDHSTYEPWYAVEINGSFMIRNMFYAGKHKICLFRNMTYGVIKRVFFYRELQAMWEDNDTHVIVKGFHTDGKFYPVPKYDHRLEFIGDSISSGEGTYGAREDTDWIPMYMSSSRNYINMVGKNLNADVRIISQGGFGVYSGWDGDLRHDIPSYYDNICGLALGDYNKSLGAGKDFDHKTWVPDAVLINLGTNDGTAFLNTPGIKMAAINKAAYDFLKKIRGYYPASYIIWTYGMAQDVVREALEGAVDRFAADTSDKKVSYLALPNCEEDEIGSHMHPGPKCHEQAAKVITDYLKGIL